MMATRIMIHDVTNIDVADWIVLRDSIFEVLKLFFEPQRRSSDMIYGNIIIMKIVNTYN